MAIDVNRPPLPRCVSSARIRALIACCLLLLGGGHAKAAASEQDSITVDGVPLLLSLSISEEGSEGDGQEPKGRAQRRRLPPEFSASMSAGGSVFAGNAAGMPVARFAGRGFRPTGAVQGRWMWSGPRMSWRLGFEMEACSDLRYDFRQLEDSLYALDADGQGGIRQLTRQTYDLGIELDTVPLTLEQGVMRSSAITLEWRKSTRSGSRSTWSLWGGAWARVVHWPRAEPAAERVPESGLPDPRGITGSHRSDWMAETTWGAGAFVTIEQAWSRVWSGFIRLDVHAGQRQYTGLRLGLTRRFRRA